MNHSRSMNRLNAVLGSVWPFKTTRNSPHDAVGSPVDGSRTRLLRRSRAATSTRTVTDPAVGDASRASIQVEAPLCSGTLCTPGRTDNLTVASSLTQGTQEQSMSQKAAQAHVIASGADPTSSEPLYAALSRAEAAEGRLADLQEQFNALVKEQNGEESVEPVDASRGMRARDLPSDAVSLPSDAVSSMHQPQTRRERELETELQLLKAQLNATASGASLEQHFLEWQMVDDCLQALKQLDDTSLKQKFKECADIHKEPENSAAEEASTDAPDKCRLSKQGLAALFAAEKTLSEGKLEELMVRIDTDGNGEIDWYEFRALARSSSELEMMFRGLPLERVLASCFAIGAPDEPLEAFFSQKHSDVVAAVIKARYILEGMVLGLMHKHNDARARAAQEQGNGGAKYGGELKGGTVEKFFEGVTGICGEPHPDLELGMAEEHVLQEDSNKRFSTNNYAVTTTPVTEFGLVIKGMGITTGPASKVWQDFAKNGGKGSNGWKTRADLVKKTVTAHGCTLEKVLVPDTQCCRQKGGEVPEDLRVLHPIEAFGDFGENGRLRSGQIYDADTLLQKEVKKAGLTRAECVAVVLYTGPCFMLYNGLLRGFGDCGEVPPEVEAFSDEFWKHLKKVSVKERMEKAGHKFSSTMHVLVSAIKKIQAIAEDDQGTVLYRGLGGLDVRPFMASSGFTETAFMSSTRDLSVALEYSGSNKGMVGTVIAIHLSKLDNGADITKFSQYPAERETVWNTCAFLEYCHGRDEIHVSTHGVVRVLLVKANANTKALTVEELEMRRKNVVVALFDTIHNDIVREIDSRVQTEQFQQRLAVDKRKEWQDEFIASIKSQSVARAEVFKGKAGAWFASNAHLGKAVSDGLALSTLAKAKYTLWLRDRTLTLRDMGYQVDKSRYHDYQRSYGKLLALQRQELTEAEEAAVREDQGSDGDAGKRLEALAVEECVSRRWIADVEELEHPDEATSLTPLWAHLSIGNVKVVERLLQARASPEAVPGQGFAEGMTPLVYVCKEGYADAALLLLKYKANTEATDQDYSRTGLLWACSKGHLETARVLVAHGASLEAVDKRGNTALQLASDNGKSEVAEVVCKHGARGALWCAARFDLRDMLAELISKGHDLEECDKYGKTGLHWACAEGHLETVRVLAAHGASLEAVDKAGRTGLLLACYGGHLETARVLVAHGASLEAVDKYGWTGLHYVCEAGDAETVRVLAAHGASLVAVDKEGITALEVAEEWGRSEVVAVLKEYMEEKRGIIIAADQVAARIAAGQDVNARDEYGRTGLHWASVCGDVEMARVLVAHGASLEAVDKRGNTALQLASCNGKSEVAEVVCKHGARGALWCAARFDLRDMLAELISKGHDLEECDKYGKTGLHWACAEGHAETVRVLVAHGASLEAVDKGGRTGLLLACYGGHLETARVLVAHGASLEAVDKYGWTGLHYVCETGDAETVRVLVAHGASLEAVDKEGITALEVAEEWGRSEVVAVLKEYMEEKRGEGGRQ